MVGVFENPTPLAYDSGEHIAAIDPGIAATSKMTTGHEASLLEQRVCWHRQSPLILVGILQSARWLSAIRMCTLR